MRRVDVVDVNFVRFATKPESGGYNDVSKFVRRVADSVDEVKIKTFDELDFDTGCACFLDTPLDKLDDAEEDEDDAEDEEDDDNDDDEDVEDDEECEDVSLSASLVPLLSADDSELGSESESESLSDDELSEEESEEESMLAGMPVEMPSLDVA